MPSPSFPTSPSFPKTKAKQLKHVYRTREHSQHFDTVIKVDTQVPDDTTNPDVAEEMINSSNEFKWVSNLTYEAPLLKTSLMWSRPVYNLEYFTPPHGKYYILIRSYYGKHHGGVLLTEMKSDVPTFGTWYNRLILLEAAI